MKRMVIMVGGEGELSYRVAVEKKINQAFVSKKSQRVKHARLYQYRYYDFCVQKRLTHTGKPGTDHGIAGIAAKKNSGGK